KEEVRTEYIDYEFVTEETDDMYLGVTSVERYGEEGEKEVTYKCKYVDGELEDEEIVKEKVVKEPVDQLELVVTYVEPEYEEPEYDYDYDYDYDDDSSYAPPSGDSGTFTDHNGNKVSYINVLTGSATAYYAAEGSHTATGVPVYVGGVAVNPDIIPYGTQLYIVSSDGAMVYGYATAVDTGGALMSGEALVDVFYPTYEDCVNWGRRNVTVYILG
ncbi:MAG: G5 domain-containing protein, partial [Clostridia bacterium]|nr:G5 domain-containing protein [Clostridia bacterium]